jgi:hypothetical protein
MIEEYLQHLRSRLGFMQLSLISILFRERTTTWLWEGALIFRKSISDLILALCCYIALSGAGYDLEHDNDLVATSLFDVASAKRQGTPADSGEIEKLYYLVMHSP